MIRRIHQPVKYSGGTLSAAPAQALAAGREKTIAYRILKAHNTTADLKNLRLRFDALASHDITYVGIIQTARSGNLEKFPMPYVLTNCHNSLCAVGGTINEDDHVFGLSAAQKYGGIYVPAHMAVIHAYMREMMSGCGRMILGSDSHTRYGALGTMGIGEGGPELVKQLLGRTFDLAQPAVVAVHLTGAPRPGVGPQDVALALIGEVFADGYVKNAILEFVGQGVHALPAEFRNGIDVMTTETACLSSVWETDEEIRRYYVRHGRPEAYAQLSPEEGAVYDRAVEIDLSRVAPMIAMPFHPSLAYKISDVRDNAGDVLRECEKRAREQLGGVELRLTEKLESGKLRVDQGVIAGCAGGTYDNLCAAADILRGRTIGDGAFTLSVYPASQPVNLALMQNGVMETLIEAGCIQRTAFCGPCFGAGDVPCNRGFSIRHSTRNFPNREGSKPAAGQIASVALMDARSIAATAANGGWLTPATDLDVEYTVPEYTFDRGVYERRCYFGFNAPHPETELRIGPNIKDWPKIAPLKENLLLKVCSVITDPVTTTDELIPSGETSSYRSNPMGLAEFTLSRKDPAYVGRAKAAQSETLPPYLTKILAQTLGADAPLSRGSVVYANRPGDGSAREQAASCQRVLGGAANIAKEYATKRYRSNLINWGMLPLLYDGAEVPFGIDDYIILPAVREKLGTDTPICGILVRPDGSCEDISFTTGPLDAEQVSIIKAGCLVNDAAN